MKNIMFRAWNKKTKQMEHVLLICFVNKYVDVLPERNLEGGSQESWGFEDIELMQSTGRKDKNGKSIYEGDVFGTRHLRCIVKRAEDGAYKLVFQDKRIKTISILDYKVEASGIVGNIYANPDLI